MRILILLLVVVILLLLLKRLFSGDKTPGQLPGHSEDMRQCKYCGVHVPESAAITVGDNPYCSQEHADLDQG